MRKSFGLMGLRREFLLLSVLFGFYFLIIPLCLAQTTTPAPEQITITTYYPSPYGVYQALEARRMVIGVADTATNPMPDLDGMVNFQGRHETDPAFVNEGTLFYNDAYHDFRYYDSQYWQFVGACVRMSYSPYTGTTDCPEGFNITQAAVPMSASGNFLCCRFRDHIPAVSP